MRIACLIAVLLGTLCCPGPAAEEFTPGRWVAQWIAVPNAPSHDYGVYHFRRSFKLSARPARFPVRISADNRYILFVNGKRVAEGPARGDLFHWRFESIDLAPQLNTGVNSVAAVVWNDGRFTPMAQITNETGFWMEGETAAESVVDTGDGWRSIADLAYSPNPIAPDHVTGYIAIGPQEILDASKYPWGWERPDFNDASWQKPRLIGKGEARGARDGRSPWMLVPSSVPQPERRLIPPPQVRKTVFEGNLGNIPAGTKARFLLEQEEETTGYPRFTFSGGRGAKVGIRYAEGLWEKLEPKWKGDRESIEGKHFLGYQDIYIADGGDNRVYEPLYWRTWRFLEVTIETASEPLRIDEMSVAFSGYPFQQRSRFSSKPADLSKILSVGWHTARLCAHETYMDCPYYEQLQYAGDTRIQGLVSIYNSGDTKLLRNAIQQLDQSRIPEGLTYSRAPSRYPQIIPGFSLWWIGMVHDYWWYTDDPRFVKEMLPGVRAVLTWFALHQRDDQTPGRLPWWNYLEWTASWASGVPPSSPEGGTASADLQLALGYQWAADLEEALGNAALAAQDRTAKEAIVGAIRKTYFNARRGLFADTAEGTSYSQQTNALAVISGAAPGESAKAVLEKTLSDRSLTPASTYFLAYVNEALKGVGLGDKYLDQLSPWRAMLDLHLTTWAENLKRDRSDCHAWGSSPNYELYRTVLGIDSAAPGFKRVRIEPSLGPLTEASGSIPHPQGEISVRYSLENGKLHAEFDLPLGTPGEFVWKGQRRTLKPGHSAFTL